MQKDGCAISGSSNTWQNSFLQRHSYQACQSSQVLSDWSKFQLCYCSGKYSLQGFLTASNAHICQHPNCYCQKDTKIFYKLSNNKSARLIWGKGKENRQENLPGLILGSTLGHNFPGLGIPEFPAVFPLWEGLGWVWREGEEPWGRKCGGSGAGSSVPSLLSPRAGVRGRGAALSALPLPPGVVIPPVRSVSLTLCSQQNRCSLTRLSQHGASTGRSLKGA